MSWIESLVYQHREVESPASFWFWSGMAAISAVVKDQVWVNRGGLYKLYPNIFVILYAESGLKKGQPINLAQHLVKTVNNTNIISGRSSIQGILKKMGEAKSAPGGKILTKSTAFICASELASSLVDDPAALNVLTDLFDRSFRADEWESLLKMDSFKLKDPTVCLLGGINEAHADSFFNDKDIKGGFLGRTFVIHEDTPNTINSLALPMEHPVDIPGLSEHLKEIANLKGEFENFWVDGRNLTPTGKIFNDWYIKFVKDRIEHKIKDDTGTLNRFSESVVKIAMLLSLSRGTDLRISPDDMISAITVGEKLIGNIRKTTMHRKGLSERSPFKALVIKKLLELPDHSISRVQLMKLMYMHYTDSTEFENTMQSFVAAGLITMTKIGNELVYKMLDSEVEKFMNRLKGKME